MIVKSGKYRITTDKYQWMFQEFKGVSKDKNGKESENWDTWGYYPNLEQLIKATTERLLRRADGAAEGAIAEMVGILKPLLKDIREAQAELLEIVA